MRQKKIHYCFVTLEELNKSFKPSAKIPVRKMWAIDCGINIYDEKPERTENGEVEEDRIELKVIE